jgi:DNA-binding transcriptional LysR family regulator
MLNVVVELGSFSAAAEFLNVSQATISYSVAKLEEELGISILKLAGRKYKLTETGNVLVKRSQALLREAVLLENLARSIREGSGQEVRLAVSQSFPTRFLIPALQRFSTLWRHAKVTLIEVPSPEIDRVLYEHSADIVINSKVPSGFTGDMLIEMEYVAVAHPNHPLFQKGRELTEEDLCQKVRIISIADMTPNNGEPLDEQDAEKHWYVSNFDTAVSAICEGIGYGWLPKHRIQESLQKGKLKILPLQESASYKKNFYLIHSHSAVPSTDAARLAQALHSALPPSEADRT